MPTVCGAANDYKPESFPPSLIDVGIHDAVAADVNADGAIDLVLSNGESPDSDDYGFFVLLGPQHDPEKLVYHAFVRTGVIPLALAVHDLVGTESGCLDVTVFGPSKAGNAGLLETYHLTGTPDMFDPIPLAKDVQFIPPNDNTPVLIAFGDFQGMQHGADIAVADLFNLRLLFTGGDATMNLPTAVPQNVGTMGPPGPWNSINAVYAEPSVTGTDSDDLFIVELDHLTWLRNDGTGAFASPTLVSAVDFSAKGPRRIDLDGMPPLDVVAGGGVGFGGYLLAATTGDMTIVQRSWNQTFPAYNEINDFAIADLGGTPLPEVVALEADETRTNPALAFLVDGLFDAGTELLPKTVTTFSFADEGIEPDVSEIVDFNGDSVPEWWAFQFDGEAVCLRRQAAAGALELCE